MVAAVGCTPPRISAITRTTTATLIRPNLRSDTSLVMSCPSNESGRR